MKKILLSLVAVSAAFSMNAQVDTLTEWFTGTPVLYNSDNDGFVCGTNGYDDLAKYQRFDAAHGISGDGQLTEVLIWIGHKADAGGSFNVNVVDFAGGALGTILGSTTVTLASVDTTTAGFMVAEGTSGYNLAVTFSPAISVTSASDIVIGIVNPLTQAAGDSIGIVSNTTGDFTDASTHTWEVWSDLTLTDISTAWGGLDIGMAFYPVIDFTLGLTENSIEVNAYPNPTSTVLNIQTSSAATTVSILSMDGKVVSTTDMNGTTASVNVANLNAGVYFYEVAAADGSVVRNTFVKK